MEMADPSSVWPENQMYLRPVILTAYIVASCMLSAFIAKRTSTWTALRSLSFARILVLLLLVDSFLFVTTSAVIIFGVGTSFSEQSCAVGIWWCIALYASSKVFIYMFLMERVHLVSSAATHVSRWRNPFYCVSCVFFAGWIAVAIAMIVGRIAFIRQNDRACVIGLKFYATVSMLTVDAIVNIYLTAAFVWPIYRSKFVKARALARNSSIAAMAALATSFANIVILNLSHGQQLSWVCLGSCGLDVTANAAIIFYITRGGSSDPEYTDSHNRNANHRASTIPACYFPGGGSGGGMSPESDAGGVGSPNRAGKSFFAAPPALTPMSERAMSPFSNTTSLVPNAPMPVVLRTCTLSYSTDLEAGPPSPMSVKGGDDREDIV